MRLIPATVCYIHTGKSIMHADCIAVSQWVIWFSKQQLYSERACKRSNAHQQRVLPSHRNATPIHFFNLNVTLIKQVWLKPECAVLYDALLHTHREVQAEWYLQWIQSVSCNLKCTQNISGGGRTLLCWSVIIPLICSFGGVLCDAIYKCALFLRRSATFTQANP